MHSRLNLSRYAVREIPARRRPLRPDHLQRPHLDVPAREGGTQVPEGGGLQKLRARLAEIDAERAQIHAQIEAAMQRIAAIVSREVKPAAHMPLTHHILWILRSNRAFSLSPTDVAQRLGMTRNSQLENIRVHLSRMRQKGWIKRVAHGRYQAHSE